MNAYITMEMVNGQCWVYGYMSHNDALVAASRDGIRAVAERAVNSRLNELGFNEIEDRTN